MLGALGAAAWAGSGSMFAPSAPEADVQLFFAGGAVVDPGYQSLAFGSTMHRAFGRHVVGARVAALEREGAYDKQGMFSLSAWYGFEVLDTEHVVLMPFLHVGGFVQGGLAGRVSANLGEAELGADASVGWTWELPFRQGREFAPDDRGRVYGVLPEAGVFLDLGGPVHPTARLGVVALDPIASVQIGGPVFARGAVTWGILDEELTAWVGFGLRLDQD